MLVLCCAVMCCVDCVDIVMVYLDGVYAWFSLLHASVRLSYCWCIPVVVVAVFESGFTVVL